MFKSLKCQSGNEKRKKVTAAEDETDLKVVPRSPRPHKSTLPRRISRWKMENTSENENFDGTDGNANEGRRVKTTSVTIERKDGTLGITLRGGLVHKNEPSNSILITQVKPGGPADLEGTIKPGDRLLAVNGVSLQGRSLTEAQALLKENTPMAVLTIEYDVKVLKSVDQANGPLLVEIERPGGEQLGITLYQYEDGVVIEHLAAGSIADRCGALNEGDEILAVNNQQIDTSRETVGEVVKLLEEGSTALLLEILPARSIAARHNRWRSQGHIYSQPTSGNFRGVTPRHQHPETFQFEGASVAASAWYGSSAALTYSETLNVSLMRENGSFGLELTDGVDGSLTIVAVHVDSPAERSGCLYPGDRILAIANRNISYDKITATEAIHLLDTIPNSHVVLLVEFDILQTVVPANGIFSVRLFKRGAAGLGLTIAASSDNGFMVCELKKGSLAHRAGSLQPGDRLLEINQVPLEQCTAEHISNILHQCDGLITLKLERNDQTPDFRCIRKVTCTVELQRYGGPLGIVISGSEELNQPIVVSGLTSGGLAEQTGVLHVGDQILAINEHSLSGEPLSTAHALLHNSPDLVTLKVSRNIGPLGGRTLENTSPVIVSSIDSAVESWGSSPSPDHSKNNPGNLKNYSNPQEWPNRELHEEVNNDSSDIQRQLDLLANQMKEEVALISANSVWSSNIDEPPAASTDMSNCNTIKCSPNDYVHMQPSTAHNAHEPVLSNVELSHARESSCVPFDFESFEMSNPRQWQSYLNASQTSLRSEFQSDQLLSVTLAKDLVYEDFGFSVSDGLYERGVFINRIRKGGPADLSRVLLPYDRILQVNDTCTQDFDCCLTVPLIATAGETLKLLVARPPHLQPNERRQMQPDKTQSRDPSISQHQFLFYPTNKETRRIVV